jgi:molybdopterin/thiamine biosynthesis adenylyltransferase
VLPRYLPLRNFKKELSKLILDLGAGPNFFRIALGEEALDILAEFCSPHTPLAVSEKLNIPLQRVSNLCNECFRSRLLIEYVPVPEEYRRYDRNLLYYSLNQLEFVEAQKKLSSLSIGLIGMGGIGNWVSLNLIGLGVKKLRLIDGDNIEKSNLCRQILFTEENVNLKKVEVAKAALEARNSCTEVEAINEAVTESNINSLVQGMDFIVLSADSPVHLIQKWTNYACVTNGVPFFTVGYSDHWGVIGPLISPKMPLCLACNHFYESGHPFLQKNLGKSPSLERIFRHYQAPSFTCLNSYVSSIAAYEIVKYFLNFGKILSLGTRLFIDSNDFTLVKKEIAPNPECKVCGSIACLR